jgi:hypothetical protein
MNTQFYGFSCYRKTESKTPKAPKRVAVGKLAGRA